MKKKLKEKNPKRIKNRNYSLLLYFVGQFNEN